MSNLDNMTEFERRQQIDEDAERRLQRENDREDKDDKLYHLLKDEGFSDSDILKMTGYFRSTGGEYFTLKRKV